ncbi:MAG: lysophospholipase [Sediminibacterium sp.]|nr:lysophospholipase [Sediminibacterium sp.]
MTRNKFFRWLKIFIVLYCVAGIVFYYLQERLLFHPVKLTADSAWHFTQLHTETNIRQDAETNFNLVQFPGADSLQKGIVLYFHGNRENVNHYAVFADNFTRHHYEVWMPDYPGFGKSTGKLTEQSMYDEALQVYKLARTKYQPQQIIIYGKSLGTGVAAHLAAERDCSRLILETPYYSFGSMVKTLFWMYPVDQLLKFKMPTCQYLPRVTAPISIFHGSADGVIPYRNASRLKALLKPADEFITIPGGSHNDLNGFPLMQKKLDSLLSN